jgi:chromosome partitioning protein
MIIAVANHKGGSGKSTTAAAMAAGLAAKKRRVLLIDIDAQGNTTEAATGAPTADGATVCEVLTGKAEIADAIRDGGKFGDFVPASPDLAEADSVLTATGKEFRLKKKLQTVRGRYDFIIIDTPPSLGVLTVNALTAATGVVIPVGADKFGIRGVMHLHETIGAVREFTNKELKIYGFLLTRHSDQKIILRDFAREAEKLAKTYKTRVYKTFIRECVAVREAQAEGRTIFDYAPKSNAAADYAAFVQEFIKTTGGRDA